MQVVLWIGSVIGAAVVGAIIDRAVLWRRPRFSPETASLAHRSLATAAYVFAQGADGYVTKDVGPRGVLDAVGHVASGRKFVSSSLAELLARRVQGLGHLTPREMEILRYYSLGFGCVEIASRLSLSPKTVSTHKTNGMRKLGLKSTADLVRWAIEHGES
jgi:DNA-binding NarL/FixJ family response regulator